MLPMLKVAAAASVVERRAGRSNCTGAARRITSDRDRDRRCDRLACSGDIADGAARQALSQIDHLHHLLQQLQRAQFGRRSEERDLEQLRLAFEDVDQTVATNEAGDDKKDAVAARARADERGANRGALPAHLPRVEVTIEPDDTNCPPLQRPHACDRRRDLMTAGRRSGAVPGDRDARPKSTRDGQ
jgi:Transposase C of IS166 homeodomain